MSNINFSTDRVKYIDKKLDFNLDSMDEKLNKIIHKKDGGLFLLKLPSDNYCKCNAHSLKYLLENGYQGVYISFQRPFENVHSWLKYNDINTSKIKIIDGTKEKNSKESTDVLECKDLRKFTDKINNALDKIKGDKKFLFIDSITTMTFCRSDNAADFVSLFLQETIRDGNYDDISFFVNVAEELEKKKLVKQIASHADGIFDFSYLKGKYSKKAIHTGICT